MSGVDPAAAFCRGEAGPAPDVPASKDAGFAEPNLADAMSLGLVPADVPSAFTVVRTKSVPNTGDVGARLVEAGWENEFGAVRVEAPTEVVN